MPDAWILDGVRTPIGRHRGALASVRADDLAAHVVATLVQRGGVAPDAIDDVYLGCTNGVGEDSRNVARMAALLAGLPHEVPGATVNRLCASGMEAVAMAARAAQVGDGSLFVAGGVESMSRAPWAMLKPERALPTRAPEVADTTIGWRFVNPRMADVASTASMGETAENVARRYGIDRTAQDELALMSHRRAVAAQAQGAFEGELIPTPVAQRGSTPRLVTRDEGPRSDTTRDALASLRPAFVADGTVTAGNSSSLNDGACALLVGGDHAVARRDAPPLARVAAIATVGVDPAYMGMGPVPATRLALRRAGLTLGDLEVVELNEAFAAQAVACMEELGLDRGCVNLNGGAIALGHPLGCTGARLVLSVARQLRERRARYGLATMCVGVGQGMAVVLENPDVA